MFVIFANVQVILSGKGVISDLPGQTDSSVSSDHYFKVEIVLSCAILKKGRTSVKNSNHHRL